MTRSGTLRAPITALRKDHLITASAVVSSDGRMVRPRAFGSLDVDGHLEFFWQLDRIDPYPSQMAGFWLHCHPCSTKDQPSYV
jgi:hypothetical protein